MANKIIQRKGLALPLAPIVVPKNPYDVQARDEALYQLIDLGYITKRNLVTATKWTSYHVTKGLLSLKERGMVFQKPATGPNVHYTVAVPSKKVSRRAI